MKFTIDKKSLVQMLRALTKDSGKKKKDRDPHLRVAAHDDRVVMSANDVETGCEAQVEEEGVCFFQYEKLLPLIQAYTEVNSLTIEVNSEGIQIGNTKISRGFWEISLFADPKTAPKILPARNGTRGQSSNLDRVKLRHAVE